MTTEEIDKIVAFEQGRLDAKYDMGYDPRRSLTESSYREGYQSDRRTLQTKEPAPCTYAEKINWGWY